MTWTSYLFIWLLASFLWSISVKAEINMVALETFEGVKTLNAGSPGQLGAFAMGGWHCRPVGPRLASSGTLHGWSADAQGVMTHTQWDLSQVPWNAARDKGMMGCWVRFEDLAGAGYFNHANQANPAQVLQLISDNIPFQCVGVTADGRFISRTFASDWIATPPSTVRKKTWYWIQIEWALSTHTFSAKASIQPLDGVLTELSTHQFSIPDGYNYRAYRAEIMNAPMYIQQGQHYMWRGRLGGAVLAGISALGEGSQPHGLLPPVEGRHEWHVNPFTGDDANDGLTPETAWRSTMKINQESAHAGMLSPAQGGFANGDSLIIDTSTEPLDLGANVLEIRTPGLTLRPPVGQKVVRILAHKNLSTPDTVWLQAAASTHPHVWMTTDGGSQDMTDVVIWENDRWLHHPTGMSVAAVMDLLESTPGSFFCKGGTLFLHPFEGTNPNTDGKTYTRSRFREGGSSAVKLLALDLHVQGLDVRKTTLARSSDNDPYTAYGIQGEQGFGGETRLEKCYVDYAGKHCIGFTDANSGRHVTVSSCQVEQGTPYSNQTPWVDYNGINEASGNRTTYINCINHKPSGLIGSVEGSSQGTSYYAHNNGVGLQFECIQFIGGVFAGQVGAGGGIRKFIFENGVFGGGGVSAKEVTVQHCVLTQLPIANGATDGQLIARHNLCVFSDAIFNGNSNAWSAGNIIYEGNTFDLRPYLSGNHGYFSLFLRTGPLNFTFRNNIFIAPAQTAFNVLGHARSTDTLTFSDNLYQTGSLQIIVASFHDGNTEGARNFQEWQALGYDERSRIVGELAIDAAYIPEPTSPATHSGINLGNEPDFSGRFFEARTSIGAFEPADSYEDWALRYQRPEPAGGVLSPASDEDWDGFSNWLEFAMGTDPRQPEQPVMSSFNFERAEDRLHTLKLLSRHSLLARGPVWRPEISVDLKNWYEAPRYQSNIIFSDPKGWQLIEYNIPLSSSTSGKGFVRLMPVMTDQSQIEYVPMSVRSK